MCVEVTLHTNTFYSAWLIRLTCIISLRSREVVVVNVWLISISIILSCSPISLTHSLYISLTHSPSLIDTDLPTPHPPFSLTHSLYISLSHFPSLREVPIFPLHLSLPFSHTLYISLTHYNFTHSFPFHLPISHTHSHSPS